MKSVKWTSLALAGAVITLVFTGACTAGPVKGTPPRPVNRIGAPLLQQLRSALAQLNLTQAQQAQVRVFFGQAETALKAIRENASLTPEQKRAATQEAMKNLKTNILGVLTPEQKERLREIMTERRDDLREFIETLDLTQAQKRQIQAFFQEARTKLEAIRANQKMTPPEKRTASLRVRRELEARIMRVLTPQQREQLRQWLQTHRPLRPGIAGSATPDL